MEQERALQLLLRQLRDIQAQADRILAGENSAETIESFARYSSELKDYVGKNVDSRELTAYLADLPEINYSRSDVKLWHYLILPAWWVTLYKDYEARNKTIAEIGSVRGKYATLELMVKGLVSD